MIERLLLIGIGFLISLGGFAVMMVGLALWFDRGLEIAGITTLMVGAVIFIAGKMVCAYKKQEKEP